MQWFESNDAGRYIGSPTTSAPETNYPKDANQIAPATVLYLLAGGTLVYGVARWLIKQPI